MIFLRQAQRSKHILKELLSADLFFDGAKRNSALHNTHAFATRFHPDLPRRFIEALTEPGDLILDPMCGSGTTVIEAALAGRIGVGLDCDPLAVKLSRVKTCKLDLDKVRTHLYRIVNNAFVSSLTSPKAIDQFLEDQYDPEALHFFHERFSEESVLKLGSLVREIQRIGDSDLRNFFEVIFSSLLFAQTKRPKDVIKFFLEKGSHAMASLREFCAAEGCSTVVRGDCRHLPIGDNRADLVMTAPPYGNTLNLLRGHQASLYWLGMNGHAFARLRDFSVGIHRIRDETAVLQRESLKVAAPVAEADRITAVILGQYLDDLARALSEMYRVLKPGKAAVLIMGPMAVKGVVLPAHEILGEVATMLGFDWSGSRAMAVEGNGNGQNHLHREYVVGLIKRS